VDNYQFCIRWVIEQAAAAPLRVLDYGCGAGKIVVGLREMGVEAYGCDTFYEGGDSSQLVDTAYLGNVIRRMEASVIPFGDQYFDLVVNNQVMEHVEHLDPALAEISRVLRPGGRCLSLFPDKSVWREGHCGIPFLHWFPRGSKLRIYYAAALRTLGFGAHKEGKGILRWSSDFCSWLDAWTWYRDLAEIEGSYTKEFSRLDHIEHLWAQSRLGQFAPLYSRLPQALQRWLVRKLVGLVLVSEKPA
jgi:SAM-dependent methyltransferase